MSKSIELTPTQIEAFENGATVFILPINDSIKKITFKAKDDEALVAKELSLVIQIGDKDIFVKEEFVKYKFPFNEEEAIGYYGMWENDLYIGDKSEVISASKMPKEQSRYSFTECIDVRVVRVKDINILIDSPKLGWWSKDAGDFEKRYNDFLKEKQINRTYKDNDYVFLLEFSRISIKTKEKNIMGSGDINGF